MKRKIFQFLGYALLVCAAIFSAIIFWPRHYHAPALQERANIRYWDLRTGSRIAYTFASAKGIKKPNPVIYLHGGPGGVITDKNIRLLSPLTDDGYDVYWYDQIGSGHSARLADIREYTAERHQRDLEAIVQQTGAEKVILIGQSWGAILATLFAADHPDQLEKIIFTCPGPIQPRRNELANEVPPDSLHLRPPYFSNAQGNALANNLRTDAMAWIAQNFGKKLASNQEADEFATYLNQALNRSLVCDTTKIPQVMGGVGFYVQVMTVESLNQIPDPRAKLRAVQCPVLVMKGQCDNQKWGFTREYLDIFPHSQLIVIPDAGHSIAVEQPELYIRTIKTFLSN